MTTKKLPKKKIFKEFMNKQFREWIIEVMKQEKMRFANSFDVANEIERIYGGLRPPICTESDHYVLTYKTTFPKEELAKRAKR